MEMSRQFANFLLDKPCRVYPSGFGVRLNKGKHTAFQPDITVVCDHSKFTDRGCEGAPDLVVEILSPSTARFDRFVKLREYLRAGVREYWIVDPVDKLLYAHRLKDGVYNIEVFGDQDTVPAHTLPGCNIDLTRVFVE